MRTGTLLLPPGWACVQDIPQPPLITVSLVVGRVPGMGMGMGTHHCLPTCCTYRDPRWGACDHDGWVLPCGQDQMPPLLEGRQRLGVAADVRRDWEGDCLTSAQGLVRKVSQTNPRSPPGWPPPALAQAVLQVQGRVSGSVAGGLRFGSHGGKGGFRTERVRGLLSGTCTIHTWHGPQACDPQVGAPPSDPTRVPVARLNRIRPLWHCPGPRQGVGSPDISVWPEWGGEGDMGVIPGEHWCMAGGESPAGAGETLSHQDPAGGRAARRRSVP